MLTGLFLLFGLLDKGQTVAVCTKYYKDCLFHQNVQFKDEIYTQDGLLTSFKLTNNKSTKWNLFAGPKVALEYHYRSSYYNEAYLTLIPTVSLITNNTIVNVGSQLELGKAFYTISSDSVGRDKKGLAFNSSALFFISVNLDKPLFLIRSIK